MKIFLSFLATLLLLPLSLFSQTIFQQPLSPRIANYQITVRLDTEKKLLQGEETIRWRNHTANPTRELQFHLYMNAFRNRESSFLKNRHLRIRRFDVKTGQLGGVDIKQLVVDSEYDLTKKIEFIHPDDGNEQDSTVIRVPLPREVKPGESVEIQIQFETRLPEIIARTGYSGDFFLIAQWFPKLGVLEDKGWNCHQFHPNSEFFSDFGVYDVSFTLPKEYVVGATGILVSEERGDSLQTLLFHAEDVHDFALTAYPRFQKATREIEGVQVVLLYPPEHAGMVERYFIAITYALQDFGSWYLPYPYPNLTLVDPPIYGMNAGGMEYPCFITVGSVWGMPKGFKLLPEEVTVHEFGHQYFYGILANNEFEEAWLDEGFTSYATTKVLDKHFGKHTSFLTLGGILMGDFDHQKKTYMEHPKRDYIVKPSWKFELGDYGRMVYSKAMLTLMTLENYLGEDTMGKIMKTYFQRWKFKHPHTQDFIDIVNEIAPENMDWFLKPALYGTEVLDYEVYQIAYRKTKSLTKEQADSLEQPYNNSVTVLRRGEFVFPVELRVVFDNGDTLTTHWDGKERYKIFHFQRPEKLVSACVDPENKIYLDINWTNNSRTFRQNELAFQKHWLASLSLFQNFLLSLFTF